MRVGDDLGRRVNAVILIACLICAASAGAGEAGDSDESNGVEARRATAGDQDRGSRSDEPQAAPSDSRELALEARYVEVEKAWKTYLKRRRDHEYQLLEIQLTAFLNEAVNGFPDSPWTLRGVDLYCESRLLVAAARVRSSRDFARGLSMLRSAKAYYDLLGETPDEELLKAIERYQRKMSN